MARIQSELVDLLGRVAIAEPERRRAGLRRMTEEPTAHLGHEERTLLPLLEEVPWPPAGPAGPPAGRGRAGCAAAGKSFSGTAATDRGLARRGGVKGEDPSPRPDRGEPE
ncbi:hypothetical protein Slala05_03650 [Streptomyces lavendulae subsp. lavendulae]|nr:hypothetical protein Slala05_03650 [Streptomyces lavendulae subsp. lavendulae]